MSGPRRAPNQRASASLLGVDGDVSLIPSARKPSSTSRKRQGCAAGTYPADADSAFLLTCGAPLLPAFSGSMNPARQGERRPGRRFVCARAAPLLARTTQHDRHRIGSAGNGSPGIRAASASIRRTPRRSAAALRAEPVARVPVDQRARLGEIARPAGRDQRRPRRRRSSPPRPGFEPLSDPVRIERNRRGVDHPTGGRYQVAPASASPARRRGAAANPSTGRCGCRGSPAFRS